MTAAARRLFERGRVHARSLGPEGADDRNAHAWKPVVKDIFTGWVYLLHRQGQDAPATHGRDARGTKDAPFQGAGKPCRDWNSFRSHIPLAGLAAKRKAVLLRWLSKANFSPIVNGSNPLIQLGSCSIMPTDHSLSGTDKNGNTRHMRAARVIASWLVHPTAGNRRAKRARLGTQFGPTRVTV